MNTIVCECEHADHFPLVDGAGWPSRGHRYGRSTDRLEPCRTSMGTFQLCAACRAAGHLSLAELTHDGTHDDECAICHPREFAR